MLLYVGAASSEGTSGEMAVSSEPQREAGEEAERQREGEREEGKGREDEPEGQREEDAGRDPDEEEMESQSAAAAAVSVVAATGEELSTPMEEGPTTGSPGSSAQAGSGGGGDGEATNLVPSLVTSHVQEQPQQESESAGAGASPLPSPGQSNRCKKIGVQYTCM